jgi:hypothetical protein
VAKELVVTVSHELSEEEAVGRVKRLMSELKRQYGEQLSDLKEQWDGNRCLFSMKMVIFRLTGSISVGPSTAEVRTTLPLGAGPFEEQARSLIEDGLKQLLS